LNLFYQIELIIFYTSTAGNSMKNAAPFPIWLSTQILPSCKSIICLAIYNPNPVEFSPAVGCAESLWNLPKY
jgi:hypothetical protein